MARNFVSSGDHAKDREIAKQIEIHEERMERNICPNGCGRMIFSNPFNRACPACGFEQWSDAPIEVEVVG